MWYTSPPPKKLSGNEISSSCPEQGVCEVVDPENDDSAGSFLGHTEAWPPCPLEFQRPASPAAWWTSAEAWPPCAQEFQRPVSPVAAGSLPVFALKTLLPFSLGFVISSAGACLVSVQS